MKKMLAALLVLLCLLPAAAMAEIKVNGAAVPADSDDEITIATNGATITGSATGVRLVLASGVSNVTFDNVQVTAPEGNYAEDEDCAALTIEGSDVTLTFIGKNNVFVGGANTSTTENTSGGNGINAAGNLTIKGSVTAKGGAGMDGGDGIKAKKLTLEGAVSAEGGIGGGNEGGEGIESSDELLIAPTAVVTVVGGAGKAESGHGIDSTMVTISSGAMLSVMSGGADKPAIDGSFSGAGYESDDGVNWTPTTASTKRYFTSRAPAEMPETGDASMLGAWVALLGASAAGLKIRRKR